MGMGKKNTPRLSMTLLYHNCMSIHHLRITILSQVIGSDFCETICGMTQAELAKRAKITQANLVAIESGKVDPRVSTLQRIL